MNIGFDAKRAYQNNTGLGHYSRTLLKSLAESFPQHQYILFAPKITDRFNTSNWSNMRTVTPQKFPSSWLRSLWRSRWVKHDLIENKIDIYHGLSHEIPTGLNSLPMKKIVTVHDLIFERYPSQYNKADVLIHRKKIQYACRNSDRVIAISQQTKDDLINLYRINENKIDICYQSCNPAFGEEISAAEISYVKVKYQLPDKFLLYVGSIIERKNLLTICKAIHTLGDELDRPLVAIGEGGTYKNQVKEYIKQNKLEEKIILLSEHPTAANSPEFRSAADFPAIYKAATAMIYPSVFEGFGIPVLEALLAGLPVITSNV
ncbi:MAG TPA: glycosyltransferase family 1 protein, partial [Parasegetibacter sp.]